MARAKLRTLLPFIVLAFACTDEDPTGVDGAAPDAYLAPNTGLMCASDCLTDDVSVPWSAFPHPPSGSGYELRGIQDPRNAGGVMEVTYCRIRSSDGYLFGCYEPTSWWKSGAEWPTGKVKIGGREPSNITRVTFESFAPLPQVSLLEYERPENPVCSYGGATLWCNGGYRLKVSVKEAGWYDDDRFYLAVEKADGTRWGIADGTGVVSGETVTWTWDALPYAEPGSKLVVTYYAWNGQPEGKREFVLPLRDASSSLSLEATEAPTNAPPGGPMRIQVGYGTPVLFTPSAQGASFIQILGWEWTPQDTAQMPLTGACAPYENPCEAPVYEAGTMKVTARVDAQERTAMAPVGIMSPQLRLDASQTVAEVGDSLTFTASAPGAASIQIQGWQWAAKHVTSGTTVVCTIGINPCSVLVRESGTMWVTALVDGETQVASVAVNAFEYYAEVRVHVLNDGRMPVTSSEIAAEKSLAEQTWVQCRIDIDYLADVIAPNNMSYGGTVWDAFEVFFDEGVAPYEAAQAWMNAYPIPAGSSIFHAYVTGNVIFDDLPLDGYDRVPGLAFGRFSWINSGLLGVHDKTLAHEIGHGLGLGDSSDATNLMAPDASATSLTTSQCETARGAARDREV